MSCPEVCRWEGVFGDLWPPLIAHYPAGFGQLPSKCQRGRWEFAVTGPPAGPAGFRAPGHDVLLDATFPMIPELFGLPPTNRPSRFVSAAAALKCLAKRSGDKYNADTLSLL